MIDAQQNEIYKTFLRRSLLAVPLTPQETESVVPFLEKTLSFLTKKSKVLLENSPFWDFAGKAENSAKRLGMKKEDFVKAALKQPTLFYQSPDTINANIEGSAERLGIKKEDFVKAGLKQPQLFCQSPDTILRNYKHVKAAAERGFIRTENLTEALLSFPTGLCYSPRNTKLRAVHTFVSGKTFSLSTYFAGPCRDKNTLESDVIRHYTDIFNRTGRGTRTMQVLHKAGVISALPDWASAPTAP